MEKQIADLTASVAELSRSNQYWHTKATERQRAESDAAAKAADAARAAEDDAAFEDLAKGDEHKPKEGEDDLENPDTFVDKLSTEGVAAVDAALQRRGFVRKADVVKLAAATARRIVENTTQKLTRDQQLFERYPDLRDQHSPLFEATAKEYQSMIAEDPKLERSPVALAKAAELAALRLGVAEGGSDDYIQRTNAGMGDSGRRHSYAREGDSSLSPSQKLIADRMGVKYEDYAKVASRGVQIGGRPTRR
jgi:hypothetical protein